MAKLDTILKMVMASANKEQNQMYPPSIFTEHYNLVTKWLLDEAAKLYPHSQSLVDIVRPFLVTEAKPVSNGLAAFPETYRNLLSVGIYATNDLKEACKCEDCTDYKNDPLAPNESQIKEKQAKKSCRMRRVTMVEIDEWDDLTTHPYKSPDLKDPIGCIFSGEGIRVCPFEVPSVEIRYLRHPKTYVYGYDTLPDDTYVFNPDKSTESEWEDNATSYLYKAVSALYAMYVRDPEMRDYNVELRKIGLF